MNPPTDLTVCVLAPDDADALELTLSTVSMLGYVVVGLPEHSDLEPVGAIVHRISLDDGVGQAWTALLRAAPTDRCLLLHAGEVVVTGRPADDDPFGGCVVISHPHAFELPDRLGHIRLVDRRRCTVGGHLRPVVDGPPERGDEPVFGSTVIADTGHEPGPAHHAWLQHLAARVDDTTDPAELLDVTAVLAAGAEYDAALVRLRHLLFAYDGDLGRRVARLTAMTAVRRSRRSEAMLGSKEWERLDANPGPALALRGAAHVSRLAIGPAIPLLDAALAAGLTDDDGVAVDRTWIESMLSDAKVRLPTLDPLVAAQIKALPKARSVASLCERWHQTGRPLRQLAESLRGEVRARFVAGVVALARALDATDGIDMAEWLATDGVSNDVIRLVNGAASRGDLALDTAIGWSERLRATGKAEHCPLVTMSGTSETPPVRRVLAAAILVDRFRDDRGTEALELAVRMLHTAALAGALYRVVAAAPSAVPAFVEAGTNTPARAWAVADALERCGAGDVAEELRCA